jgi:hypothetical protein
VISLKKIALVCAAALTSTVLLVPSANAAAATTLTVNGSAATGGTAATAPVALPVPADNSVDLADALKIAVTGLDTGTVVTAVATNATLVPAVATSVAPVTSASGTANLSISTGTGTTADIFVYTKTTAVGTVSVTIGGNTTTYYVQGTAGALNAIALTAPESAAAGSTQSLKVTGYDVFGNLKGGASINAVVSNGSTASATTLTTDSVTATNGTKTFDVVIPAAGQVTVIVYATVATAIAGMSTPVGSVSKNIAIRDLAGELAAVQAALAAEKVGRAADKAAYDSATATATKQIADLTAALVAVNKALATLKAKYNAMAKRYKFATIK